MAGKKGVEISEAQGLAGHLEHSKRPRVRRQHAHMLKHSCACWRHTWARRFQCSHGGVLNLHTVGFSACQTTTHITRQHTAKHNTAKHSTQQSTTQHTTRQHLYRTLNTTQHALSRHTRTTQHNTTHLTPNPHPIHTLHTHTRPTLPHQHHRPTPT